jgi:hypothetical protein
VVINLPPARLEATSEHKRKHFDVTNMCAILSGRHGGRAIARRFGDGLCGTLCN